MKLFTLIAKICNIILVGFWSTLIGFSRIPGNAKKYEGNFLPNLIKLILDETIKTIKTIRSIWHFFLKNRKHKNELETFGNYRLLSRFIKSNSIIYSCGVAKNISFDDQISKKFNCDVK